MKDLNGKVCHAKLDIECGYGLNDDHVRIDVTLLDGPFKELCVSVWVDVDELSQEAKELFI